MANIYKAKKEIWGDNMNKLEWQPEHFKVLDKIKVDFDVKGEMTDEQVLELDEKVSDYFALHGLGGDKEHTTVNPTGRICESILDLLSEL